MGDERIDSCFSRIPSQFFKQKVPVPQEGGKAPILTPLWRLHKLALNPDVGGGMAEALDVKGRLVGFYKVSVNMTQVADGPVSVRYTPHNHSCLKVQTTKLAFYPSRVF